MKASEIYDRYILKAEKNSINDNISTDRQRFIEIYNEYKSPMIISFMGTGLGNIITIKVKDFVFDITDNSHW